MESDARTDGFKRNARLEALLTNLNLELWEAEKRLLGNQPARGFPHPLILIMGPLRSGTTLFMQWLANTGLVSCPTNLLSRFYRAPVLGAKIQLLLTDPRYNFRDELGEFMQQADYVSENGKTRGVLAPNEFWYFWRRFLPDAQRDVWTDAELKEGMDAATLLAELAGIMDVFGKPFAAKGMLFNYNIPYLDSLFDQVLFIQLARDPVANVASVLDARKRQLGSEQAWYSFRIPEYGQLKDLDPVAQAAGQVHCINRAVTAGLAGVAESRKMVVRYEEFCADPRSVFEQLAGKLGLPPSPYAGPARFDGTRPDAIPGRAAIEAALRTFGGA